MFRYRVYGIELASTMELALPVSDACGPADVELVEAGEEFFAAQLAGAELAWDSERWASKVKLADGSFHVRYADLWEFLISADGARVHARRLQDGEFESFQVYLLGQALSFALLRKGLEPLHATAVVLRDGRAIAFVGDSGHGKSTLAACFLASGARLLTDDLLCLTPNGSGMYAHPGPQRIKLFPEPARRFLGGAAVGVEMNPGAQKFVIPLPEEYQHTERVKLDALYLLDWPEENAPEAAPRVADISAKDAFFALVSGTFNQSVDDPSRLQQNFAFTRELVERVKVRRLVYSRDFDRIEEVRRAASVA